MKKGADYIFSHESAEIALPSYPDEDERFADAAAATMRLRQAAAKGESEAVRSWIAAGASVHGRNRVWVALRCTWRPLVVTWTTTE